jgi:hypothetical protein
MEISGYIVRLIREERSEEIMDPMIAKELSRLIEEDRRAEAAVHRLRRSGRRAGQGRRRSARPPRTTPDDLWRVWRVAEPDAEYLRRPRVLDSSRAGVHRLGDRDPVTSR